MRGRGGRRGLEHAFPCLERRGRRALRIGLRLVGGGRVGRGIAGRRRRDRGPDRFFPRERAVQLRDLAIELFAGLASLSASASASELGRSARASRRFSIASPSLPWPIKPYAARSRARSRSPSAPTARSTSIAACVFSADTYAVRSCAAA
jgi:hypothetical protein